MRIRVLVRLVGLLVLLAGPLSLAAAPATYTGTAPVRSQSDTEREAALKTALAGVVIERSGDPGVLARPEVAKAVAQAERYVLQYHYRANPYAADDEARLSLVAEFDSGAVDRLLAELGLGVTAGAAVEASSEARLAIGSIRDADDFLRLMAYLTRNNFVREVEPTGAHGEVLELRLSLRTGLAAFLEAVAMERTLAAAPGEASGPAVDAWLVLLH